MPPKKASAKRAREDPKAVAPDDENLPSVIIKKLHEAAPIYRICLTGGPCAGKSTLLSQLQQTLTSRSGINIFCVPEAATLLVGGGLQWKDMTEEKTIEFQLALLTVQLALEDQFYRLAKATGKPSLVLSDRGTMDGRAYCTQAEYVELLRRGGWKLQELRDRYDAVIHMVTAAIGAPQFYNLDNPARFENCEEAVLADEKLRQMYLGHPLVRVFDNSTSFAKKIDRVTKFIGHVTGHAYPHNNTKRFLVREWPDETTFGVPFVRNMLTITILNNSTASEVLLIVKREQEGTLLFFYTSIKSENGEHVKSEHRINSKEYASLLAQRDQSREDVVKENLSFVYKSHYCELGKFLKPAWVQGVSIMYVDIDDNTTVDLPPFISVHPTALKGSRLSSFVISAKSNSSMSLKEIIAEAQNVDSLSSPSTSSARGKE